MNIDRFFRTCSALVVCLVALAHTPLHAAQVSVSQSSTAYGGLAERAYDQNVDSVYRNGSISHTRNERQPWWTLDLGQSADIDTVTLHNRTDCCSSRLADFYVLLSQTPFGSRSLSALLDDKSIERVHVSGQAADVETLSFDSSGRYLRVQLAGTNPLSLAEVGITLASAPPVSAVPELPVQIRPTALSNIKKGELVSFEWGLDPTVDSYDFHIYNRSDPTNFFNVLSGLQPDDVCVDGVCSVQAVLDIPVFTYHSWRVRARRDGKASRWIQTFFNVVDTFSDSSGTAQPANTKPDLAVNVSPVPGTDLRAGEIAVFTWEYDPAASSYTFALFNNAPGDERGLWSAARLNPADYCKDDVCQYERLIDLPVYARHVWRVQASNSRGNKGFSRSEFNVSSAPVQVPEVVEPTVTAVDEADDIVIADVEEVDDSAPAGDESGDAQVDDVAIDETVPVDDASDDAEEVAVVDTDDAVPAGNESDDTDVAVIDTDDTVAVDDESDETVTVDSVPENVVTVETETNVLPVVQSGPVSANQAARLLTQATFGPTRQSIAAVQSKGIEQWIDEQFTLQGAPHLDYVKQYSNGSSRAARHEVWWSDVVLGQDQLRQRVAFALSQLFVISDTGYTLANSQYGITAYYDLLRENAFGNYRELLEQVTLSPVMGLYLSMLQNAQADEASSTRPDENYAREVLQLFSIGLYELAPDGTTTGAPAFTQKQVEEFARVFTGWNYADAGRWSRQLFTGAEMIDAMEPFDSFHDNGSKTLLNDSEISGATARQDLEFALDNIFNHANVGPFVAKKLIRQLVTSNPSAAYVQRVASVFNSDSSGERGNLQAVVKAILMDPEARSIPAVDYYGKLREPLLRLSHLWRAFNFKVAPASNGRIQYTLRSPQLLNLDMVTGQAVLKSPSVFNFFEADYSPAGPVADYSARQLVAPEFEIFTESNELATSNRIGDQIQRRFWMGGNGAANQPVSSLDFSFERRLAANPQGLLDHLDTLLLSGNMSNGLRRILSDHLAILPNSEAGRDQGVRDVITLIMASPDYLVQM